MPTYANRCRACGHDFDSFQPMASTPPLCPECGEDAAVRLIQPVGVQFKCGGFYETDYKRAAEAAPEEDSGKT